jgi:large subunit ribosomal protein L24
MKRKFSITWKSSKEPKKQRKYRYNAPLHILKKLVSVHISGDLKNKYGIRSISVKKGDKVKIVRGQFRKKIGKVERVDLKKCKVYITGIEAVKKDGTKTLFPIHPCNLTIQELNLDDKKRNKKLSQLIKEKKK